MSSELVERISEALAVDRAEFQSRVDEEAELVKRELADGTFDNPQAIVGLEYEFYAVAWPDAGGDTQENVGIDRGALARIPRRLLSYIGFEKEAGLHNAEMSTSPQPLNAPGLAAQRKEVEAGLSAAQSAVAAEGLRLVSDGLWTIPPAGESATRYNAASAHKDGLAIGTNVSESPRYHGFANAELTPRMRVEAPHVDFEAETAMPQSLTTSIQPHYQVPAAEDLPSYFGYALRVAGPLLALGVNSPFFPPDLYDDGATAADVLADAHAEHRIDVFESVMNPRDGPRKVRFPEDVRTVEAAVDRVAADPPMVPALQSDGGRFDDRFGHFLHKHGTFWRWVRPVFDGADRRSANARVEFRPLAAQPTVRDSVAFQAAFAGLVERLHRTDHPVADLPWERARENFYAAKRDGLSAELVWITADGAGTTDAETLYGDLFRQAAAGLRSRGLADGATARYLSPLRARVRQSMTPARWKRRQVRARVDEGADLRAAIHGMQRTYLERQAETPADGRFVDWLSGGLS